MATRMQQRRGTAAQWTAANPILAAGEIGFETDTSKFKMGNGSSTWSALQYFANAAELAAIIDGAPALLNTLDELAAAIGDDANFAATVAGHTSATTSVHGIANTAALATTAAMNTAIAISAGASAQDATAKANSAESAAAATAAAALTVHSTDETNVHGIVDTQLLATKAYADAAVSTHLSDSTGVHGIADTSLLALKSEVSGAVNTHNSDTTDVHGIVDTALLVTTNNTQTLTNKTITAPLGLAKSDVGLGNVDNTTDANKPVSTAQATAISTAVSDHNADTSDVHGIADTSALATKTYADGAVSTAVAALTKSSVGLANVDNTTDANKPVSTATQTALDLKAPKASPTFTGTVSGITSTMVGLGNVDNTSDVNKPISSATTTALALKATVASVDLKAPIASPTFTGTVTIPAGASISGFAPLASPALTGTPTAPTASTGTNTTQVATTGFVQQEIAILTTGAPGLLNTLDELAAALGDDANYAATVTTALTAKAPLASPTFTGTVTLPTGTVTSGMILDGTIVDADINATAAIAQSKISGLSASLGLKANLADPTFTGTVTVGAAGVAFTDGTQTKAGVPSITNIPSALAAGAQTIASGRADQFIPLTGAVVITLPATGYSTGQSIDFYQESSTGAYFATTNGVVGTPGLKFRTTNSVATAMKTASGWLVFGDLSA